MKIGVYIHIPFCKSKCKYCDFASYPSQFKNREKYFEALKKEISLRSEKAKSILDDEENIEIDTIYIGGGTPSIVEAKYIEQVIECLKSEFDLSNCREFSIEMNPNTVTEDKILSYKNMGVNRFSLGLQSTNDDHLKAIGRCHKYSDFLNAINIIKKCGIENINADLIYNLPDETLEDVINDIDRLASLDIQHISFYSLTLMEETPLYNLYIEGKLNMPDEELERDMYHKGIARLKEKGFYQYEISNFARSERECKHNIIYWETKPYIGLGLAAHSYFDDRRWGNESEFDKYINLVEKNTLPEIKESIEHIGRDEKIFEYLMLNLRMTKGFELDDYESRFGANLDDEHIKIFEKLIDEELIEKTRKGYKLSIKGMDLSNYVFEQLMDF
jgi:oxygen-independent coproporphyrinogen-3 oxidase